MRAMQEYKQKSGRMFPTWSEVLEVLRDLGYEKQPLPPASGSLGTVVAPATQYPSSTSSKAKKRT